MGKYDGTCQYCEGKYSLTMMKKHLNICPARQLLMSSDKRNASGVLVSAQLGRQYWLLVELRATATLADLDDFLRYQWLECCGHLSEFEIDGVCYGSHPEGFERSMKAPIQRVLGPGMTFSHDYDFGSTTTLKLQMLSAPQPIALQAKTQLAAINLAPDFACHSCGQQAEMVCTECYEEPFYCESCLEDHECGPEMALPIVNSPRMGVCAYEG